MIFCGIAMQRHTAAVVLGTPNLTPKTFLVGIHLNGLLICGGSIRDNSSIITAAHCT